MLPSPRYRNNTLYGSSGNDPLSFDRKFQSGGAGVVHAPIGMMDESLRWPPMHQGHRQGRSHQLAPARAAATWRLQARADQGCFLLELTLIIATSNCFRPIDRCNPVAVPLF